MNDATVAEHSGMVPIECNISIQNFLYTEALLLGERKFEDWLMLLAEDLSYFMPVRQNVSSRDLDKEATSKGQLALFDETKTSLAMRVKRLATGRAWAEEPPSRTCHIVSNVLVSQLPTENEFQVTSCFLIYRTRLERDLEIFAGKRLDKIRRTERTSHGWEIFSRNINLDQLYPVRAFETV
ncbi:3-phenylpropionate/cinnamic acid dioxygenase subunit beta [Henriciella mobilis]|uniref:aromatic-ring-hydroxylating dioxygenase subunit beta n=1 Tax=Henriciella mobilis TaxID=2305467 RepID=UPI000E66D4CA|nr:3-phenylpropionate/cinnamic acid dioxygenase subunit beta [Henriciella mobilis]RIJ16595.1 3-phenylpropionate/cinnamic acid dioxygenase subunit beta [Henriciella mobilis]